MSPSPSKQILDEAADWLTILSERPLTESEQTALSQWREKSPDHERTWQAAVQFQGMVGDIPPDVGKQVLYRRRNVLKTIAALVVLPATAKFTWDYYPALTADYRLAKGEQRQVVLPDGSQLDINTASVVDVRFDDSQRLVRLIKGEILVTTATDQRPFMVETDSGFIRALGTRFSVSHLDQQKTLVKVYEDAVEVRPVLSTTSEHINAGNQVNFDQQQTDTPDANTESAPAWSRGQIISNNQRLGDFIKELGRYRTGILRCDPEVANLRISGVFQVQDTDKTLQVLANTLPVRINRATDYWVTVSPR